LELVYTENFKIKKLISLQLGALRMSQTYSDVGGRLSKKNYSRMEEHIINALPDRKGLDISPDTTPDWGRRNITSDGKIRSTKKDVPA